MMLFFECLMVTTLKLVNEASSSQVGPYVHMLLYPVCYLQVQCIIYSSGLLLAHLHYNINAGLNIDTKIQSLDNCSLKDT